MISIRRIDMSRNQRIGSPVLHSSLIWLLCATLFASFPMFVFGVVSRPAGVSIHPIQLSSTPCTQSLGVEWEAPPNDVSTIKLTYDDGSSSPAVIKNIIVQFKCTSGADTLFDNISTASSACGSEANVEQRCKVDGVEISSCKRLLANKVKIR